MAVKSAGTEQELVARLCRGDAASYRELHDRFAPRLLRTLERIFGRDPQLCRDAVQETFLIVFRKIGQFDGRSSLLTWITRIGIRQAQQLLRTGARHRPLPEEFSAVAAAERAALHGEPPRSPEELHATRELCQVLERLIAELPEDKRMALLLFEVEEFSVQEIADITGEPRGTVLSRLARTRAELREALRRHGEAGTAARRTAAKEPLNEDHAHVQR